MSRAANQGFPLSQAEVDKHYADAQEHIVKSLNNIRFDNAEHSVKYSQARDWTIDCVFAFLLAEINIVAHAGREMRLRLESEVKTLKAKVKTLEARPQVNYRGVYRDGETYPAGSLATHAGSMWYANSRTTERPGNGPSTGWTLAVKSGSFNGRDNHP
jgi:hypothetical protein